MRSHEENVEVWRAMEELAQAGKVGQIGLSNFYEPHSLYNLFKDATVKPTIL